MALFRVKATYTNDASTAVLEKAGVDLLRLMGALGLAKESAQVKNATLMRSPEVHAESVLQSLAAMLALPEAKKNKMKAAFETRRCNDEYDHESFQNTVNIMADTFH